MNITMTNIDVFVWHDTDGNITAVGTPHPSVIGKVTPLAATERSVIHLNVPENSIKHLHKTHYINVVEGKLVQRD